jgi:hypothetical protein
MSKTDITKVVGQLVTLYNDGDNIDHFLRQQKTETLITVRTLLAGTSQDGTGEERKFISRDNEVTSIIELIDSFDKRAGEAVGGAGALFTDTAKQDGKGDSTSGTVVFNESTERYSDRTQQEILPRTKITT